MDIYFNYPNSPRPNMNVNTSNHLRLEHMTTTPGGLHWCLLLLILFQ